MTRHCSGMKATSLPDLPKPTRILNSAIKLDRGLQATDRDAGNREKIRKYRKIKENQGTDQPPST